jgi:hypothetical protein
MKTYKTDNWQRNTTQYLTEIQQHIKLRIYNGDNSSLSPKSPDGKWCDAEDPAQEFENF